MAKATLAQGIEVLQMIERGDYDREMMQAIIDKRIIINSDSISRREVAELKAYHYRITVESVEPPTYGDIIANYGEGNVSQYCRYDLHESLCDLPPPTGEVTVFLKQFDRPTTSEKVIKWADEHGYRLVFPWEREALTKAFPDLQLMGWIVDLGSYTFRNGRRYGPLLRYGKRGQRCLGSSWVDGERTSKPRFLFAIK